MTVHDHACVMFDRREAVLDLSLAVSERALSTGSALLLILSHSTAELHLQSLSNRGLDPKPLLASGRATLCFTDDVFLHERTRDEQLAGVISILTQALARSGCQHMFVLGDVTAPLAQLEQTAAYEAALDAQLHKNQPFTAFCMYDRTVFPNELLREAKRVHPVNVVCD
eukprot:TRINITY_DN3100_c0_g1_i1.p2 TRINITY_DN3100_c0_g1~~TRINITY_DN3100_c0_g1_i1.p2  ORF type:complete len:169 (-),score=41.24 TRINITY_DN3100_c0_g1_i1:60-566(-)